MQGKVYKSPFTAFRVKVRSEAKIIHPSTGVEMNKVPSLVAEFGVHGGEFLYTDPITGRQERGAHITGGYFDSAEAAERLGWNDDEHETVVSILDQWCSRWPEAIQLHSKEPAGKPWPTYDETHHNQIPVLAEQLGLAEAALAYESENKNRDSVVGKLHEVLAGRTLEAELVA